MLWVVRWVAGNMTLRPMLAGGRAKSAKKAKTEEKDDSDSSDDDSDSDSDSDDDMLDVGDSDDEPATKKASKPRPKTKAKKKPAGGKARKTISKKGKGKKGENGEDRKPTTGGLNKPMKLSSALSEICGGETVLPRTQVTKGVWAYIKANNMQSASDKRQVILDAKLVRSVPLQLGLVRGEMHTAAGTSGEENRQHGSKHSRGTSAAVLPTRSMFRTADFRDKRQ